MSDVKIKPCPFCGGEAKRFAKQLNGENTLVMYCSRCGAFGPTKVIQNPRIKDEDNPAIKAWNKRVLIKE